MSDPKAIATLAETLDEICMEIAELDADVADFQDAVRDRATSLRKRVERVARMGGLPALAEYKPERTIRKVS